MRKPTASDTSPKLSQRQQSTSFPSTSLHIHNTVAMASKSSPKRRQAGVSFMESITPPTRSSGIPPKITPSMILTALKEEETAVQATMSQEHMETLRAERQWHRFWEERKSKDETMEKWWKGSRDKSETTPASATIMAEIFAPSRTSAVLLWNHERTPADHSLEL